MNIFNRSIQKIHKYTGIIIALFFLMWFISGIVLLYHKYPRISDEDRYAHTESLQLAELPPVTSIPGLSDSTKLKSISVSREFGQTVWSVRKSGKHSANPMEAKPEADGKFYITSDSVKIELQKPSEAQLDSIAALWAETGTIIKKDTLTKRGPWVLYERYEKSLPIIKYSFDNPEKSEIFISQNSGEVLQATTRSERIWSWFGAIPHKFYFANLRTNLNLWKTLLLIDGLLCLISALSGFYIGIYYLFSASRKQHHISSPFKKKVWKYHHIAGLIFGIFLIGWGISGSLAMQRVPKWLVNYDDEYFISSAKLWGKKSLPLSAYKLDYREILSKYPDVKSISWEHFGKTPAYHIISEDNEIYINASRPGEIIPLSISRDEIEKGIKRYYGDDVRYTITLMQDYDEYYLSAKNIYPLPVWKVEIENKDGSRLYISPEDGHVKYVNNNRMVRKWLFAAAHYLDIKYFVLHQTLRYTLLWILAAGCIFVIATGVIIFFTKEKAQHSGLNRKKRNDR